MNVTQYIFTSTIHRSTSYNDARRLAIDTIQLCHYLGVTGRVFASNYQAFCILEGPKEATERYYAAITADEIVDTVVLHSNRAITAPEFKDFSVWLKEYDQNTPHESLNQLTALSVNQALPKGLSAKVRILVDAYLLPELAAAG